MTTNPKTIYKVRDGRRFFYFASWTSDHSVADELTANQAKAFKNKGVPVIEL